MTDQPTYGFGLTLELPYAQAVERVTAALAGQGFGILTEIDVKATLKKKLDVDTQPYIILGACNPPLAHQALTAEPGMGLLLPCNVIVYATDDQHTVVSVVDPMILVQVSDNPAINAIAQSARDKLQAAIAALETA